MMVKEAVIFEKQRGDEELIYIFNRAKSSVLCIFGLEYYFSKVEVNLYV